MKSNKSIIMISLLLAIMMLIGCVAPAAAKPTAEETKELAEKVEQSAETQQQPAEEQPADAEQPEQPEETEQPGIGLIEMDPSWTVYKDANDMVRFIGGKLSDRKIESVADATELVNAAKPLLGASEETEMELFGSAKKVFDCTYYTFAQKVNGQAVNGSTVKLIVDANQEAIALNSALAMELPAVDNAAKPEQAEEAVKSVFSNVKFEFVKSEPELQIVSLDAQRNGGFASVYRVYTNNPGTEILFGEAATEKTEQEIQTYPYLVHYVRSDGKYLYYLKSEDVVTFNQSDNEYNHDQIFKMEGIEPVDVKYTPTEQWKGKDVSGGEVTLHLSKNADGNYLFIDTERHIVMCDYQAYTFKTDKPKYMVRGFVDINEVDQDALMIWARFAMVYDYYKDVVGWVGADGNGTDIMLLYYACNEDGTPIDDAFYHGARKEGFDVFTFGKGFGDAYALDIMAHEFTHTFTHASLIDRAYYNEYGAINEAMSDIIGYSIDMEVLKEDGGWLIGREQEKPLRSFSDPLSLNQPEMRWGAAYQPPVYFPNADLNDNGGVHINSSLINRIAYLLWTEGGMTFAESARFWMNVDMAMTVKTGYEQLAVIMTYMLPKLGYEKYADTLASAIEKVNLLESMPETLKPGTAMLQLSVDQEMFTAVFAEDADATFRMQIYMLNTEKNAYLPQTVSINGAGEFIRLFATQNGKTPEFVVALMNMSDQTMMVLSPAENEWKLMNGNVFDFDASKKEDVDRVNALFNQYKLSLDEGNVVTANATPGFTILLQQAVESAGQETTSMEASGADNEVSFGD